MRRVDLRSDLVPHGGRWAAADIAGIVVGALLLVLTAALLFGGLVTMGGCSMGDVISIDRNTDDDILIDIFIGMNIAAGDLGYGQDRIGWLRRMERVLSGPTDAAYVEFTEGLWDS